MANRRGERTVLIERGGDNLSYRTVALDAGEGGAMENTAFVNDEEDFATNRRPDLTLADDSISAITVTPEPEEGGAGPTLRDTSQTTSDRPRSQEDLLFRLRVAHLTPGVDWFEEILSVARTGGSEDVELLRHVLNTLREYPLSMKDKIILSYELREHLVTGLTLSHGAALDKGQTASPGGQTLRRRHFRGRVRYLTASGVVPFGLWEDSIARITAFFGTHVGSYFRFLRFLTLMNATVALLMFCFVSLPQIVPQEVISEDVELGFFGELSRTIFFFGAHSNSSWGDSSFVYERPLAYLVTWCGVNVLSVLLIVVSMYMSYRRIKRAGDDGEGPYSSYSLIGWDHSVTSKEGGTMRSVAISTHLKEMMREEKATRRRSVYEKLRLYCIRVLFNAVSLCVLGGSAGLIYYVADLSIGPGAGVPEAFGDFLQKYQLTILVSGLKVIIPPILNVLLVLERYHPRTQIKLQIARTAVFYAASLIVFLGSVFSVASSCMDSPVNATQTGMSDYCCWENEVGEQLFQVVILDFIISLVFGLVFIAGRALVVKFCNATKLGYDDFDVPGLILDLVYGQSLLWLGLYSAPFLSAVGVVKQTVLFYFHYGLARACCVPPRRVFRASRSGTFFLFVLLVSLLACLVPMTYSILMIEPSESCGPFRQERWTYEVLTDRVGEASSWVQDGLRYASHPGLVVPLLLLLVLLVLYYRSKSSAHRQAAKDLRHHLQFERKVEKRRVFATARLAHGISQVGLVDAAGKNLA